MKNHSALALFTLLLLSACGGGHSGGPTTPMQYTVGGSVSGLTASGLVLADNGADALSVPANATGFTFPTPIASGGAYAVTVQTQPTGETCMVGNGSGMASANVTSVTVSCTAITYTIGGSVTGLSASGLVLVNNGADALSVPANATSFTFSTPVNTGGAYAVTVKTQPTGETCTVGNGSGTASANVTNVTVACTQNDTVAVTVDAGPSGVTNPTFNIPSVSVTVCQPGTQTCATIDHVLLDTASSGLRLLSSVLTAKGLSLPAETDGSGNAVYECFPFGDGYAWGAVASAQVRLGGETTSGAVPVEVIDDSGSVSPPVPAGCTSTNPTSVGSLDALNANGVLGIGVFMQDCGSTCASTKNIYFTCPANNCSAITATAAEEVSNPVASLPTDNNGVIVEMQSESPAGSATASGSLLLGLGTESNNSFSPGTVLTVDAQGNFTTLFESQTLSSSFLDTGSNALFFNTNGAGNSIATCSPPLPTSFYCPSSNPVTSPLTLPTATDQDGNGNSTAVQFQIADLSTMNTNNFALPDVAGPAPSIPSLGSYFDWGMPFFYGRNVYVGIEGAKAGSSTGPFVAF